MRCTWYSHPCVIRAMRSADTPQDRTSTMALGFDLGGEVRVY
jgi:hypothetical protein